VTAIGVAAARPATAATIWDQSEFQTILSSNASQFLPVNDFQLAQAATITGFSVWLSDGPASVGGDELANGVFTSFAGGLSWYFFEDDGGLPGGLLDSGFDPAPVVTDTGVDRTGSFVDDIFRVDGTVAPGVLLAGGTYWFGVREGLAGAAHDDSQILWLTSTGVNGEFAKLFLDGANLADLNEAPEADSAFLLEGAAQVPEPSTLALILAGAFVRELRRRARADR